DRDRSAISGTPTDHGTFDFTITITDRNGRTANAELSITIEPSAEDLPADQPHRPSESTETAPSPTRRGPLPRTVTPPDPPSHARRQHDHCRHIAQTRTAPLPRP